MAIELKQSLKMSQQLVITPQLQQAIKLLQLSRMELVEMVQSELMENPILEEAVPEEDEEVPAEMAKEIESEAMPDKGHEAEAEVGNKDGELKEPKEFDWENYIDTYNTPGQESRSFSADELPSYENFITKSATLAEHLEWQLHMADVSEKEDEIGMVLIGALDDNGYLTVSLEELGQKNNLSVDELEDMLTVIQDMDPAGVGARDLKECLLLQTRFFPTKEKHLLQTIIKEYLPLLERKDYPTLARKLKVPGDVAATLCHHITEMEPKPGRPFGGNDTQYVTPDVHVHKVGNEYVVVLNDEGLPRLHISRFYQNMISKNGNGGGPNPGEAQGQAKNYIEEKLKKALWFIKSIHQRQRTIYKVAKCIIEYQRDFLDKGVSVLKPMVLRDVAEKIGVHESTVSRATSNKYIHTPQGLFEMKYFFNSRVASSDGSDMAAEAVKDKIKKLIAAEDAKSPLSDKEIGDILEKASIHIARRTVAKYREMLGILPSSRRRQLY